MVEIAVDLMLIQIIAQYVNALKKEEGAMEELQLPDIAIFMGITTVMMKTTMKPASLMEEIAVDLM